MKDLDVDIITRTSENMTIDGLVSLFQHTKDINMEAAVVSSDSQIETTIKIRLKFSALKLILDLENLSFSLAMNISSGLFELCEEILQRNKGI